MLKNRNKLISLLLICVIAMTAVSLTGCKKRKKEGGIPEFQGLTFEEEVPMEYAKWVKMYRYKGGYTYIDMKESTKLMVVPEGKKVPKDLDAGVVTVSKPLDNIYLVSTKLMALMDAIDAYDNIKFVGKEVWSIPSAEEAFKSGKWIMAGKYNLPDYEALINGECHLAMENTMIYHSPEVKEKLEELGIPTMVEMASYEQHPLGRLEWIRVLGEMVGKEEKSKQVFDAEKDKVDSIKIKDSGKTVAFFFINSKGNVVTYKTEGFVAEMIAIAGGDYVFKDLGLDDDSKLTTVNMSMEEFYANAKDADILIYNANIVAPVHNMREFEDQAAILADFKASKEGNVWCTGRNMFEQTDKIGSVIGEMNKIFTGEATGDSNMEYFQKLK